jgi:hypothetical protein
MNMRVSITALMVCVSGSAALAAPIVDGTLDGEYGAARAVQTVETQFGDASPPGNLGGSELDAAYATIVGGRLYLMITGNNEPNFNKLEIFFDSMAGGENVLTNVPQYDVNNTSQNLGGMTLENGFTADYHLFGRWGNGGADPYEVDFIDRQGGGSAQVPGSSGAGSVPVGLVSTGSIAAGNVGPNASGTALSQALDFAINDNNAAGVAGGTGAANQAAALAVTTGMEFSIALADLGNPTPGTVIRIAAMINNGDHNYLSNQILGGLPPGTINLGGDGAGGFTGTVSGVDFNEFDGEQLFEIVVVPAPGTLALLSVGAGTLARRRRHA